LSFERGFKAKANRIATGVRTRMGLSDVDPIDPAAVCAHFNIKLLRLSEADPNSPFLCDDSSVFSAVTVPCGHQIAIVHNDSHGIYRQRSNICHELGHCFCGHKCTPPLTPSGERERDGGIEAEANFVGGALLIPNEAANYIVREGLISKAQEIYGVSSSMLTYRLRVSGAHTIHGRRLAHMRRQFG
jgi:hypothetical protein